MASEWETLPIAEAPLEIIDGDRGVNYPKQEDFGPSGDCLFLNTGNVTTSGFSFTERSFITKEKDASLRKGKLKRHDVVLTTRGTVGNAALFDDSVCFEHVRINSGMVLLRADQARLLPRYLYQFVRSPIFKEQVAALTTGSAQPQLPIRDIRWVKIPLPPLTEQKAIAAVLGALDDKIELNRRMNATLEAMARALFQSWFVDFDPVRAKLAGRPPEALDKPTAALFPSAFQDSLLGPIPQGWKLVTLREISEVFSGGTPSKATDAYWNGNIPWISPKVMTGIHVNDSDDHVSESAVGNGTRMVPKGAVLVMVRGMGLHQVVRISQAQRDVTFNQDVKAIVATTVPGTFLLYGLLHAAPMLLSKVHASGHGTGVLSTEFLDHLSFAVPSPEILEFLSKPLAALNSKIAANGSESRTLATIRDTLLPKLLSGELSVHHAVDAPEAVA